ncbi:hypothetical protein, partial [Enterobacter hormaechei]|uniref:hypothetical protein n=1 Tax=Enterobacter hormaechei TaxID=158836 RepID=UPI001C8C0AD2
RKAEHIAIAWPIIYASIIIEEYPNKLREDFCAIAVFWSWMITSQSRVIPQKYKRYKNNPPGIM